MYISGRENLCTKLNKLKYVLIDVDMWILSSIVVVRGCTVQYKIEA